MNYFDHAASSPLYPEVLNILATTFREDFANPSSQHILGHTLSEKIEEFRISFLKVLGAGKKDQFIFTSSASESNNTVIRGLDLNPEDIILYCKGDHPSITVPVENSKAKFIEIHLTKDGQIDLSHFTNLLNEKVKLVLLTHINNQSGVVNPIEKLTKLVKEKSAAHVHVDAVQSFGKINFKLQSSIDSMSLTSHKIGGPKGIAGLFLKDGHKIRPLILGGAQENGFRSSTVAFPLIAGFHQAMKVTLAKNEAFSKISNFSEKIRANLSAGIPSILFPFISTSPYIVSFVLPGISSDIILRHLETRDVFISSTSACSSRVAGFNSALAAMNVDEKYHKNFLRISLGPDTKESEVENLLKEFLNVWNDLKHIGGR